jgi:hypothetical protein
MTSKHIIKQRTGDGTWYETEKTSYDSGASKAVTRDITDRTLISVDPVVEVTRTDTHGNSRTDRY